MRVFGDCVCTRLADGRVRVDEAPAFIYIAVELLAELDVDRFGITTIGDVNPVTYRIMTRGARVAEAERLM